MTLHRFALVLLGCIGVQGFRISYNGWVLVIPC